MGLVEPADDELGRGERRLDGRKAGGGGGHPLPAEGEGVVLGPDQGREGRLQGRDPLFELPRLEELRRGLGGQSSVRARAIEFSNPRASKVAISTMRRMAGTLSSPAMSYAPASVFSRTCGWTASCNRASTSTLIGSCSGSS